jgi:hypothetical protein
VPAVAAIAAAVVMLAYPLTEERLREMVQEMAQRRAAGTDKVEVRLGGGPEPATGDELDQRGGTNQLVTNAHPTAKGAGRAPSTGSNEVCTGLECLGSKGRWRRRRDRRSLDQC